MSFCADVYQIDTVRTMFPHIPVEAIQYDLQKTGSVEQTCDNILREGTLPLVRGDHGITFNNLFFVQWSKREWLESVSTIL